jgi:trehalose-phosphatase
VAFHWRGLPESRAEAIRRQVADRWLAAAASRNLVLREFDGGLELRVAGIDKGRAVRAIVEEAVPNTLTAYLGDDLTDEEAFAAMPDRGLKVLVRKELRQTVADLWLEPPDDLLDFLDRWIASCG